MVSATATHHPRRHMRYLAATLLALVCLTAPSRGQGVTLGPGLNEQMAELPAGDDLVVIVTFHGNSLTNDQVAAVSALGITQGILLPEFSMMAVVATADQIAALARTDGVRSIWPNQRVAWYNEESTRVTGVDALQADPTFRSMNGGLPITGRGVSAVINDTGVDGTHPDITFPDHVIENIQANMDPRGVTTLSPPFFVGGVPNTDVLGGHGTHVTGTFGGNGAASDGKYAGVAPGANIIGYGSGLNIVILDTVGGLYYALTHQMAFDDPIRIVSNSWGPLGGGDFSPDDPVNVATKRLYDNGIIAVFAGGNDGPGPNTLTPYAAPWVVTVAAGNKDGATLADFSSRGEEDDVRTFTTEDGVAWTFHDEPTITGPGVNVLSTRMIADVPSTENVYYTSKSGTSMATPHISGIIALMLEANPRLTFEDVRDILTSTATPMDNTEPWEAGAGYVNAYAAVAVALGLDPAPYLKAGGIDYPPGYVLTDPEADAGMAGADLTAVTIEQEDPEALTVALHVADLSAATPSTLIAAGFQVGAIQEYSVELDLLKADATTVRYTLSAKRTLVQLDAGGTVGLDAPSFDWGVRAADGSGRGVGDVVGTWDAEGGVITFTMRKDEMNVKEPPADLTATIDRSGRAAADGDVLSAFSAQVATSAWGGAVGLTPTQTVYDTGNGTARYTLGSGATARFQGGVARPDRLTSTGVPSSFSLRQNYPNPFNPVTTIGYALPQASDVHLSVYDVTGRLVRTLVSGHQAAGTYHVSWNATDARGTPVASGLYLYRMVAGDVSQSRTMVLLK